MVALATAAGTAPAIGGTAHTEVTAAVSPTAEPGAVAHIPSSPSSRQGRQHHQHHQRRGRGADRLADVSLEVLRLGTAAHRTGRSYAKTLRAVRAGRARAAQLRTALDRERRRTGELHRLAGRIADAQYRTGDRLPFARRAGVLDGAEAVMRAYRAADRRQLRLAAHLRDALHASRSLAADDAAEHARSASLDARRSRLDAERRRISRNLGAARGRLQELSRQASRSGRCGGLPGRVAAATRTAPEEPPVTASGARWTRPVERYELSAGFGGSGSRWAHGHTGQDFAVPVGTPVRSVGAGRIIRLTCGDGFGISMVVQHGADAFSQYAHLSAAVARPGQRVRPGQRIALSGTTGNSTGPHLHFEVRRTPQMGSGIDPVPWLVRRGVRLR
ncbi:M23 family metallopeptidase [Streptomyces sp. NPDC059788]|uniref:M23 family metallopeptidase n=1 Tax=Streptomyces sp. NPDC059788 TaxID=3346948 RepID=UPI00365A4E11